MPETRPEERTANGCLAPRSRTMILVERQSEHYTSHNVVLVPSYLRAYNPSR